MQPVALFPFKASWIIAPHVQKEILILYNIACHGEHLSLTGKFETLLLNIHFSIWQKNFLFKTLWENIMYLNQAFFTSFYSIYDEIDYICNILVIFIRIFSVYNNIDTTSHSQHLRVSFPYCWFVNGDINKI